MKYLFDLVMNLFYFWGSDYYGERIDFQFALALAKAHADNPIDWDAEYVVKGGEE